MQLKGKQVRLWVVNMNSTANKLNWKYIQDVSCSPVFEQIRTTDENG
jgi:hypothetical protein